MTSGIHASPRQMGTIGMERLMAATVAALFLLAGCGAKKDKPASQTAAKVNKEEITVHQINFVLQQQRGLAPGQAASASKQILERLVDQELAVQKAQEQKLDRDPRIVQQLEAARREIIARAYVEKIAEGAPKPSPAEIKAYYDAHPALFKERRVYSLQELAVQTTPDQIPVLQAKLAASKDLADFVGYLKANDFKYNANQAVRGAEQLPLSSLDRFAQLKEGQSIFNPGPNGAQIIVVSGIRSQPVDEARATAPIEQYLLNERKRKVVEDDLKALHSSAKIDYVGDYAKGALGEIKPAPAASEPAPLNPIVPTAPAGPTVTATPQIEVEPINSGGAASAPSFGTLEKGLKGLK